MKCGGQRYGLLTSFLLLTYSLLFVACGTSTVQPTVDPLVEEIIGDDTPVASDWHRFNKFDYFSSPAATLTEDGTLLLVLSSGTDVTFRWQWLREEGLSDADMFAAANIYLVEGIVNEVNRDEAYPFFVRLLNLFAIDFTQNEDGEEVLDTQIDLNTLFFNDDAYTMEFHFVGVSSEESVIMHIYLN